MKEPLKPKILVFGSGGHAKVVINAIECQNKFQIQALVDPFSALQTLADYSVLRDHASLAPTNFVVAIGDNTIRKKLYASLVLDGWTPQAVIHPSAIIARDVEIGAGTVIFAGAIINPASVVGENAIINTAATVDHDGDIGSHCHIAPGCHLAGNVMVAEGAFLGIGARIIPKVKIGSWSVTGAGSVVIKDVEAHTTVVGVPAKLLTKRATVSQ
ncbi:MAG: acetyltransferase [Candidatus Obscuribacterales bacterium]|nr:acetyltransferase [Candidatus Obscuribacterales bacterium]